MLVFESITKSYHGPEGPVPVLSDLDFALQPGDLAVIQGSSGCGKSTLLFTAGAMLPPDKGKVVFNGHPVYRMSRIKCNRLRGTSVGFIFQRFHLIPYLNVEQNILWPLRWSNDSQNSALRLPELVRRLEIRPRLAHYPAQLSAGEQQRVAVARALLGGKTLICADEPTGNLDEDSAAIVIDILKQEADRGAIVLLVTHQRSLIGLGNVRIQWEAGNPVVRRQ